MSRNLARPFFPQAPESYNKQYLDQLAQAFSFFLEQAQNPGEARHTNLTLTTLQADNDVGLENGALFEVDGILKVSQAHRPHVSGVGASTNLGQVEVKLE
jgi:hypothetical protein